jgi:hypothetical protein
MPKTPIPKHFGACKPVLQIGVPKMLLRAYVFEAIVLAVFALALSAMFVWGGIVHSVLP